MPDIERLRAGHRRGVAALMRAALEPTWRLAPDVVERFPAGFLAVEPDDELSGFVAVDPGGTVPLIVVAPHRQRSGVGSALLSTAAAELRATGVDRIRAGAGGGVWPGVPLDLPGAVAFFTRRGWTVEHDTLDLTCDLRGYRPPPGIGQRLAAAGVQLAPAGPADAYPLIDAYFPSWSTFYRRNRAGVLAARDAAGTVVGALLFDGPDAPTVFAPMLGARAATIGCVGVAPRVQGLGIGTAMVAHASAILAGRGCRVCHIGWAVREAFYVRAGYRPWRRYRIFERTA